MDVQSNHGFGIDLGTTYSTVCQVKCKKTVGSKEEYTFEYVTFQNDRKAWPSLVAAPAKGKHYEFCDQAESRTKNVLSETKRLIGMSFDNPEIQRLIARRHFDWMTIVPDDHGKVMVEYDEGGVRVRKYPWEISAMVLTHLHDRIVEHCHIGASDPRRSTTIDAVISVPAYFTHFQRVDTIQAATQAGFNVVKVVNEPTAAALVYGSESSATDERLMVFDFGGGTLDVTVMDMRTTDGDRTFQVISTHGDTFLGGVDFDRVIADIVLDKTREYDGELYAKQFDLSSATTERAQRRVRFNLAKLLRKAKDIKETHLFAGKDASFNTDEFLGLDDDGFDIDVAYSEFLERSRPLFDRCMACVEKALAMRNVPKSSVDRVILVGGSSLFAEVQRLLAAFFSPEVVFRDLNHQLAVANGAAILQDSLFVDPTRNVVQEVCPVSLGMKFYRLPSRELYVDHLFKASDPIPGERSIVAMTMDDNQENFLDEVYQGDEDVPLSHNFIISYRVGNLPRRKQHEVAMKRTMKIDENGLVTVSCEMLCPEGVRLKGRAGCKFSLAGVEISNDQQQSFSISCEDFD